MKSPNPPARTFSFNSAMRNNNWHRSSMTCASRTPGRLRGDLIDQGNAKLQQLNYLRDQLVGGANGLPPAAIRAIIASAIADARACTMEVRGAAGLGAAEARAALQSASEAARAA
ncbi:MAG: hypothetical protein WDN03_02155 [Rhizomicrobium sp.]